MFIGAIVAGFVGFILGFLTLRLRGLYAAIMAWFVGIAILGLARNLIKLTRGSLGLSPPSLLETSSNRPYFYIILIMMVAIYIICKIVTRSHYGLAFRALGQNIDAARASGINPTKYRVFNFTLSCFCAGLLGGGLCALLCLTDPTSCYAYFENRRGACYRIHWRAGISLGWHSYCIPICLFYRIPQISSAGFTRPSSGYLWCAHGPGDDILSKGSCRISSMGKRKNKNL